MSKRKKTNERREFSKNIFHNFLLAFAFLSSSSSLSAFIDLIYSQTVNTPWKSKLRRTNKMLTVLPRIACLSTSYFLLETKIIIDQRETNISLRKKLLLSVCWSDVSSSFADRLFEKISDRSKYSIDYRAQREHKHLLIANQEKPMRLT